MFSFVEPPSDLSISCGRFAGGGARPFRDLMMPVRVRMGAVTPRTRAILEQERIRVFEDAGVLEAIEDGESAGPPADPCTQGRSRARQLPLAG